MYAVRIACSTFVVALDPSRTTRSLIIVDKLGPTLLQSSLANIQQSAVIRYDRESMERRQ